uniref:Uncharacterized protein n=1 Tax=Solanum tuberosum TaxID=4113 RepID=M0ZQE4_SOLTU
MHRDWASHGFMELHVFLLEFDDFPIWLLCCSLLLLSLFCGGAEVRALNWSWGDCCFVRRRSHLQ